MADMTKNSTASSKVAKVFIYLILGLLAVTIIVPVAWVFVASIKENSEDSISRTLQMRGKLQTWVLIC